MKNKITSCFKLLGLSVVLASVIVYTVFGASISKTATAGGNGTNLISGACQITLLSFVSTNVASATKVVFFDSVNSTTTFSNASYPSIVYTPTLITNAYTNYFGVINSNVYVGLIKTTNTIAGATNNLPIAFTITVSSNTPAGAGIMTVNIPYTFLNGVTFTNDLPITVSATYSQ